ncbi:alanine--tRNA ligase [bacterium]|nr:alanine--tRNA ligase [bacterium]
MIKSSEIRAQFIDFFKNKEHTFVKSSPVIPQDDPTLLFINAGMNQFKDIFLDKVEAKYLRAVNSQKCIRAGGKHNDLDEVGKDGYHHTFFEMLGNWSFGDYYKKEAISWAWELITQIWKLDKTRLYATVHHTDQEAYELWKEVTDIDPAHISYHGDKDNFWEMGETGPCGPCTEIHYDRGGDFCGVEGDHNCNVNGDCHRYMEIWNLVFMQYYRETDGSLTPLKKRHVDTGSGFERICQIIQGKDSNYHTDLFMPIIEAISKISEVEYDPETSVSHRVIADHIRCLTFALADGGMPSNEGRGYVLRRILRRAARYGRNIGLKEPFLYKLVDSVISVMGDHFSELAEKREYIIMIIKAEEERFNQTLDKGLEKFEEIASNLQNKTIPGAEAFTLYDTFGFPIDLTNILAEERGLLVDMAGFNQAMEEQRDRARQSSKFSMDIDDTEWVFVEKNQQTQFIGYDNLTCHSSILRYALDDKKIVKLVLDKTPFYAESGGQTGDKGEIENDNFLVKVFDVKKVADNWIHLGKLVSGVISGGQVIATVTESVRRDIASNHTATHLLHSALRKVLGPHVQQKGSLVDSKGLRFDFTHFNALTKEEIGQVEDIVNNQIRKNNPLQIEVKSIEEAKQTGAIALFGEKYGDQVRVVSVADFSRELCGGTHVHSTGEIGSFKIVSESSSAAGIRRIEAITGDKVIELIRQHESLLHSVKSHLNANDKNIEEKIEKTLDEIRELKREIEELKAKQGSSVINDLVKKAEIINDFKVVISEVKVDNPNDLRTLGDQLKDKLQSGIGILLANLGDKVSLLTVVTPNLTKKYHAGKIVGELATILGGKGGGRPDSAMAGGKDIDKIPAAIKEAKLLIQKMS